MTTLKKARVLKRWTDKLGMNLMGTAQIAPIVSFKFGFDAALVDEQTDPDTLLDIPAGQNPVASPFYSDTLTAPATLSFGNGRFLAQCQMPAGAIPAGQVKKHNVTELYDQDGDLIAVALDFTTHLTSTDSHLVNVYIDMPEAGGQV